MRVVCLTHVEFEGPGHIADWAAARGHTFEVLPVYDPDAPHPSEFDMLVVMGGPMSIHDEDEHPWLIAEKRLIKVAIQSGKLVLGVCLGAQMLASVLGARVFVGPEPEIGWFPVDLADAGRTSGVTSSLPARFDAIHWHGDTFEIPEGGTLLASSELTRVQAFELDSGRVVGLQFHLELSPHDLSTLIDSAAEDLKTESRWVSTAEKMLAGPERFATAKQQLFALLDGMAAVRAHGGRTTR